MEKNLNPHSKKYLVDQATNQANVILLNEVGVSNSPSGPGVDILSECQCETVSWKGQMVERENPGTKACPTQATTG